MAKKGKRILSISINFQKRDRLSLTNDQFIILSAIFFRQCAPSGNGWCSESNINLSYYIEKTDRTVQNIKKFLVERGFIIRNSDDEVKVVQAVYDFLYMQEEDDKVLKKLGDFFPIEEEEQEHEENENIGTQDTKRKNFTHENHNKEVRKQRHQPTKTTTSTHEKISPKDRLEDNKEDSFKKEKKNFKVFDHELFRSKIYFDPSEMTNFQMYLKKYIGGIINCKLFDNESHKHSFLKIQLDQIHADLNKRCPFDLMMERFIYLFKNYDPANPTKEMLQYSVAKQKEDKTY